MQQEFIGCVYREKIECVYREKKEQENLAEDSATSLNYTNRELPWDVPAT